MTAFIKYGTTAFKFIRLAKIKPTTLTKINLLERVRCLTEEAVIQIQMFQLTHVH